jgi:hypothetical protein
LLSELWHIHRAEVEDKTHAKKNSWKKKYKQQAEARCRRAGTQIILYTKPGQNQQTETMLVVLTAACAVLGVLNVC